MEQRAMYCRLFFWYYTRNFSHIFMTTVMSMGNGVWNVSNKRTEIIFGKLNYELGRGKENDYVLQIRPRWTFTVLGVCACAAFWHSDVCKCYDLSVKKEKTDWSRSFSLYLWTRRAVSRCRMLPNISPHQQLLSSCVSYEGGCLACTSVAPAQTPEVCDKCSTVAPVIR